MFQTAEQAREYDDAMFNESLSTPELMRMTANSYHAQGLSCPWDCAQCDMSNYDDEPYAIAEIWTVGRAARYVRHILSDEAPRPAAKEAAMRLGETVSIRWI